MVALDWRRVFSVYDPRVGLVDYSGKNAIDDGNGTRCGLVEL